MKTMTDGLRAAAGGRLRYLLARVTTTPLTGVASGAAVTALVQSSSATTVMTVGFVGAGLLTFPHAIGVLLGANIGTTVTGWMITIIGFKLSLGAVALPGLFLASLGSLLAQGQAARVARVIAGLCLLFIGLDMMKEAAGQFGELVTPVRLPSGGLLSQFALIGIGIAMTVVMQSSSAAIAVALVFLNAGSISFDQAAAIVIGTNIGTTITAIMASIGGSRTMRQTALANLLFNAGTAIVAFGVLLAFAAPLGRLAAGAGPETALVLFHTAFNVAGTLLYLPFVPGFARLVERIIPDRDAGLTRDLDDALLRDEGAAMDAVQSCIAQITARMFRAFSLAVGPERDMRGLSAMNSVLTPALEELEAYTSQIAIPDRKEAERLRHSALLHQVDHIRRFLGRVERKSLIPVLLADSELQRPTLYLGALLRRTAEAGDPGLYAARLDWLAKLIARRSSRHRRASLLQEHVGLISVNEMFERTDALRWLTRLVHHCARIAYYDATLHPAAVRAANSSELAAADPATEKAEGPD
ncbi:Na/Pi cotransporter family protein [Rhodobacteraceae bacterium 63075]|nr:Na/Pi cotransporter family protein [Rhodobacteraceae bacterium 63075]